MRRVITWLLAGLGSLGLFEWVICGIIAAADPDNRFAQAGASERMLYVSISLMVAGLLAAWMNAKIGLAAKEVTRKDE